MNNPISAAQIRAARALLNWSQGDLARAATLSRPTVDRAERTAVSGETLEALVGALKAAGVIFVEENGDGPGVRLKKALPTAPRSRKR